MKKMFLSVVCLAAIAMLGGCSGASSVQNLESSAADSTIVTVENSNSTVGMSDNTSLASNNTVTTTKTTVAVSNGTTEAIKTNATTTKEATTTTATVKKTELTVNSFVESMSKSVTITATGEKAASMIGAVEGKSITVGGKTFEIYKYNDTAKIEEAKTGKLKLTIEGFGAYEMNSSVNGNFVLLYNVADDSVINAFIAVK